MKHSTPKVWHNQILSAFAAEKIVCHFFLQHDFEFILFDRYPFVIHLVSFTNRFAPKELLVLQQQYEEKGIKLIQLWEDVWQTRKHQVCARIHSILGLNQKIHGRKTRVVKLDKLVAKAFLDKNHLQGYVNSRYKFGLLTNDELVAVATFSALRKMNIAPNYKSAELIRFAVKERYSVTGGLSKLIKYFQNQFEADDLMSYADRDWSAGEAYVKLGFINTAVLKPQFYRLDESGERLLLNDDATNLATVFNTGSLKFILKF